MADEMDEFFDFERAAIEDNVVKTTRMEGITWTGAQPTPTPPSTFTNTPRRYSAPVQPRPSSNTRSGGFGNSPLARATATYPLPYAAIVLPIAANIHVQGPVTRALTGRVPVPASPATYPGFESTGDTPLEAEEDEDEEDEDDEDDASDSSDSSEEATTIHWDRAIRTIDDAKRQLRGEGTLHLRIKVDDDDFEEVAAEAQRYAELIFKAILTQPDDIPANVPVTKRTAWREQQTTALERCQTLMRSTNNIRDACALAMLTIREVVALHRNGIPVRQLEEKSARRVKEDHTKVVQSKRPAVITKAKNPADRFIKCSQRVDMIGKAMVENKLVAEDFLGLLSRGNIIDLVRSPAAVTYRKVRSLGTNDKKKGIISDGRKFRRAANASQAATPGKGNSTAEQAGGNDVDDAEHEPDDEIN